jgi:hypothetical protein
MDPNDSTKTKNTDFDKIINFIHIQTGKSYEFIKIIYDNKLIIKIPHFKNEANDEGGEKGQHHLEYNASTDKLQWTKLGEQQHYNYELFNVIKIADKFEFGKKMEEVLSDEQKDDLKGVYEPTQKINTLFNNGLGIYLISPKSNDRKFIKIENNLTIEELDIKTIELYSFYSCI